MRHSDHLGVTENILMFYLAARDSYCIGGLEEYFLELPRGCSQGVRTKHQAPKDRFGKK